MDKSALSQELSLLYQEKDFSAYVEKLKEYRGDIAAPIFHYNLGTAYSKMDEFALGRFHLEKAKKLGVLDSRINKNLDYVESRLSISDLGSERSFFDRSVGILTNFDLQHYLFIFLLVLFFFLALWRRYRKGSWKFLIVVFLISFPIFSPYILLKDYSSGIVMQDASLKEGPNEAFEETGIVPKGAKIIIGKRDGKWYLVKYPVHFSGWILEKDLAIL